MKAHRESLQKERMLGLFQALLETWMRTSQKSSKCARKKHRMVRWADTRSVQRGLCALSIDMVRMSDRSSDLLAFHSRKGRQEDQSWVSDHRMVHCNECAQEVSERQTNRIGRSVSVPASFRFINSVSGSQAYLCDSRVSILYWVMVVRPGGSLYNSLLHWKGVYYKGWWKVLLYSVWCGYHSVEVAFIPRCRRKDLMVRWLLFERYKKEA
jgi:hypothetical protein